MFSGNQEISINVLNAIETILTNGKTAEAKLIDECLKELNKESLGSFTSIEERQVFWALYEEKKSSRTKLAASKSSPVEPVEPVVSLNEGKPPENHDHDYDPVYGTKKNPADEYNKKQDAKQQNKNAYAASEYAKELHAEGNQDQMHHVQLAYAHRLAKDNHKEAGNIPHYEYHKEMEQKYRKSTGLED